MKYAIDYKKITAIPEGVKTDIKTTLKVEGKVVFEGAPAGLLASEWFKNEKTRKTIVAALGTMKGKINTKEKVRVMFDGSDRYLRIKTSTHGPVIFHGTMEDFFKTTGMRRIIHTLVKAALLEGKNKYKCYYRVEWAGAPEPK